jgi:cell division protein ZapA (FtsZ GTPase activity inhibitor)
LTKGRPWSIEEEKKLRELTGKNLSINEIADAMDKTVESVKSKMTKLGLRAKERVLDAKQSLVTLEVQDDLPSMEEKLKKQDAAQRALEDPNISARDVKRLIAITNSIKDYFKMFETYAKYREIEKKVVELTEELAKYRGLEKKFEELTKELAEEREKNRKMSQELARQPSAKADSST